MEDASEARVDTSRYRIKPLSTTNYYSWSNKIELVLRGKGLWKLVTGDEQEPAAGDESVIAKFARRRDVAVTTILLSIEESCLSPVMNLRDPIEIWRTLRETFQSVSEASIDAYLSRYQNLKMKGSEGVMDYVNRLKMVENQLYDIGHLLSDADKKRALLRGLREEYKVTAEVVRVTGKTLSEAIAQLIMVELSLQNDAEDARLGTESHKALSSTEHQLTDSKQCSHCGRSGHVKDECFHNPHGRNYRTSRPRQDGNKTGRMQEGKNKNKVKSGKGAYTTFVTKFIGAVSEKQHKASHKWIIDSGASVHMCNDRSLFHSFRKFNKEGAVSVGNGEVVTTVGVGTVRCEAANKGWKNRKIQLKDVLYIPNLMCNLLSVSQMRKAHLRIVFDSDNENRGVCQVHQKEDEEDIILTGIEQNASGLYEAVLRAERPQAMTAAKEQVNIWHRRLGHAGKTILQGTLPLVKGIKIQTVGNMESCEPCAKGKSTRATRERASTDSRQSTQPLDLVHTDIVGPMQEESYGGARYFIPLYDDSSALSLVRFIRSKDEGPKVLKDMICELENTREGKVKRLHVKRLRSDNDSVFLSSDFQNWLRGKGIVHELTSTYSPESNGKAERLNRTLIDMARTMLMNINSDWIQQRLWAEAVNTANFLRNRMFCTASNDKSKTPYETIMNKQPYLGHIREFGSKAFVHIPKQKRRRKFEARSRVGILVGYERGNSYRVFIPDERRTIVSRDVEVHEGEQFDSKSDEDHGDVQIFPEQDYMDEEEELAEKEAVTQEDGGEKEASVESSARDDITYYPNLRRSSRSSVPPERYTASIALEIQLGSDAGVPLCYEQAISGPESKNWLQAMRKEIEDMQKMDVWTASILPKNCRPVKKQVGFREESQYRNKRCEIQSQTRGKRFHTKIRDRLS